MQDPPDFIPLNDTPLLASKPAPALPPGIDILRAFREKPAPLDFVLPGLLAGTVGAIVSPGGAGKSMLAIELAILVASGLDLSGFAGDMELRQGKVRFLAAEDPAPAIEHRLHGIGGHIAEDVRELLAERLSIQPLLGAQIDVCDPMGVWAKAVEEYAKGQRLLFLDTLRRFHGLDENDSGQMAGLLAVLEGIAQRTGCTIVFLHHASKSAALSGAGDVQQASRGSSVLVDNIRWQAFLVGMTKEEAKAMDVDEDLRGYFVRAGVSKQNYGAPMAHAWLRRVEGGVLVPAEFSSNGVTAKKKPESKSKKEWK